MRSNNSCLCDFPLVETLQKGDNIFLSQSSGIKQCEASYNGFKAHPQNRNFAWIQTKSSYDPERFVFSTDFEGFENAKWYPCGKLVDMDKVDYEEFWNFAPKDMSGAANLADRYPSVTVEEIYEAVVHSKVQIFPIDYASDFRYRTRYRTPLLMCQFVTADNAKWVKTAAKPIPDAIHLYFAKPPYYNRCILLAYDHDKWATMTSQDVEQ